jgi:hypothetical protein
LYNETNEDEDKKKNEKKHAAAVNVDLADGP